MGILLYVVSEIVPVTLLFVIVILFDVPLTTGALNGFLFYMQILNTLSTEGNTLIKLPKVTSVLLDILNSIVQAFNLKFFVWPHLSFCLFKNMNSLQLLAFEYVTIIYSLLLTVFTVLFMNLRCNKFHKQFQRLRGKKNFFSRSIMHGLSGFLVLCYSRSTTITLQLITPITLYKEKEAPGEKVTFYYGEYNYFDENHRKYAIPAIFALVFVTCLPPFLLVVYPLCYKVLALMKLEESKFTKMLCKIVPLEKFKPFFDSFQGTFRDNHRYFAGLYFIYRLLALILHVLTNTSTTFYYLLELHFFIMMAIHAWIQPYKEKWHNQLDLYLFTVLTVSNGITLYNYQLLNENANDTSIKVLTTIQVLLAYTPLLYILIYILIKLGIKKLVVNLLMKKFYKKEDDNELELSLSTLDQERESDINYQKLD